MTKILDENINCDLELKKNNIIIKGYKTNKVEK